MSWIGYAHGPIAIDHAENTSGQLVLFQQATEVEDGSFIWDPLQAQTGKLAQDRRLVQRFFHRRIAVTEPVLHEMNPQRRHQRIGRTTTFALRVMRLDQGNQALPGYDPIHLDQEQFLAGLLTLTGILGIGEGHLFH